MYPDKKGLDGKRRNTYMISFLFNLLVLIVLAYTGYIGYKRGIISGLLGVAALVISVYIAFLVSNTYSNEFVGLVNPFVGGLVDTAITDTVERDYGATEGGDAAAESEEGAESITILLDPVMDLTDEQKDDPYTVCVASLQRLGISENAAAKIASRVSEMSTSVGQRFIDTVAEEFSITVCRVAIFTIAFILMMIIFAVIGNIFCFDLGLPGIERANNIGGAVIGLVKGIIVLMVIGSLMRYTGLLISQESLRGAFLFGIFMGDNLIASRVGI